MKGKEEEEGQNPSFHLFPTLLFCIADFSPDAHDPKKVSSLLLKKKEEEDIGHCGMQGGGGRMEEEGEGLYCGERKGEGEE